MPRGNVFGQRKIVAPQHVDVVVQQRREAGYVVRIRDAFGFLPLLQGLLQIARISQHHGIDHQPQRAQLVLHALAVALTQFTFLAVENGAGQRMTTFAAVELH